MICHRLYLFSDPLAQGNPHWARGWWRISTSSITRSINGPQLMASTSPAFERSGICFSARGRLGRSPKYSQCKLRLSDGMALFSPFRAPSSYGFRGLRVLAHRTSTRSFCTARGQSVSTLSSPGKKRRAADSVSVTGSTTTNPFTLGTVVQNTHAGDYPHLNPVFVGRVSPSWPRFRSDLPANNRMNPTAAPDCRVVSAAV